MRSALNDKDAQLQAVTAERDAVKHQVRLKLSGGDLGARLS